MAAGLINSVLTLILLLLISIAVLSAAAPIPIPNPSTSFIRSSCRATTYPAVCVQSLSNHAAAIRRNPKQLVVTALSISIERTTATHAFIRKLAKFRGLKAREYGAIRDCLEEVGDSVDRLRQSVGELQRLGRSRGPQFIWHMSNLQTWVSAALTDTVTCADGFSGRGMNWRIQRSIKTRMTHAGQLTSNALALCNNFAGKY